MGRNIWCKLPEELRERVLAFLPISQVFKCRLVCKQWNFILTSQSFKELWTNLSPPNPWFLVYHSSDVVAAYDTASSKWVNIPVYQRCLLDLEQVELMASAGGLLCFGNRDSKYSTLIVCNPLTKSQRVLPQMLQIRYIDVVGMLADKSTKSYRILVTGTTMSHTDEIIAEVYDSTLGKWIHQCHSVRKFGEFFYCDVHAIWHKGVFYCLTMSVFPEEGHCRLLKYDMERREWDDLDVKMPLHSIRCPSLLTCGGKLLIVGKIMEEDCSIKSICIWEVRMDSMQGVTVDVMPREVLREISLPYIYTLVCQGNNNLICLGAPQGLQSVVYDLSDQSWQFLPANRARVKMIGRTRLVGMSYDPNLVAKV